MAEAPNGRLRIALADDNADVRRALKSLLTALGYHVAQAGGRWRGAVASLRGIALDLVIADLDMPVMDGLEAAEECATLGLPVILLSGHAEIEQMNLEQEPVAVRLLKTRNAREPDPRDRSGDAVEDASSTP
ncbi:MAG: response regulator [Luteolibacter sp.]